MASDRLPDREQAGPSYAPSGPLPGTFLVPAFLGHSVGGHVGGRLFSVGELHAASKNLSTNGSHLNVWDFDISAAELTRVFGVNRLLGLSGLVGYV